MISEKYIRKSFTVDAVQVTEENLEEVAKWAQGEVLVSERGDNYVRVRVHNPLTERQTRAFPGDWVLYASKGYKVYTQKAFERSFEKQSESRVTILTV